MPHFRKIMWQFLLKEYVFVTSVTTEVTLEWEEFNFFSNTTFIEQKTPLGMPQNLKTTTLGMPHIFQTQTN